MGLFDSFDYDVEKALHLAVRYLGYRPRSEKEVRDYLQKKQYDEKNIFKVIGQLKHYGYINDETFARLFVENRIRYNPKSRFALEYELKQKGISSHIRDTLLTDYNDNHMARKALGFKRRQWQHHDLETQKKKAMNYLRYRGFGYEVCMAAWEDFLAEPDVTAPQNWNKE